VAPGRSPESTSTFGYANRRFSFVPGHRQGCVNRCGTKPRCANHV
jgi:hypothetical protein